MSEIREIIGNTTATPAPCSDWGQTDSTKADYIKNKPDLNMAVKTGITSNQYTLTDEEKLAASNWLGVSYENLPDKPCGGREPININFAFSDVSVDVSYWGLVFYLQTEKTYPIEDMIGATFKQVFQSSSSGHPMVLARKHIKYESEDGVVFDIGACCIAVAYSDMYKPSSALPAFPKAGIYFSYKSENEGETYAWSLTREGDGITLLDNRYLDLENNKYLNDKFADITYANLTDRPFYDDRVFLSISDAHYDVSAEVITSSQYYANCSAYLVSEDIYTANMLLGAQVTYARDVNMGLQYTVPIDTTHIKENNDMGLWIAIDGSVHGPLHIFVAYKANYKAECMSTACPKPGVYFTSGSNQYEMFEIVSVVQSDKFKPLDNKYLDFSYDDLKNRPFYNDTVQIEMNESDETFVHRDNDETIYKVSDKTYLRRQMVGATATCNRKLFNKAYLEVITEEHIFEDTEEGLFIKIWDSNYDHAYIFVAYVEGYTPDGFSKALPSVGTYLTIHTINEGAFVEKVQRDSLKMIDNMCLDLATHPIIQSLLARIEALESK